MKKLACVLVVIVMGFASGCTKEVEIDNTIPPMQPTRQISGSVLPAEIGDYVVLGPPPQPLQMTATYAHISSALDLAVVDFDPTEVFQKTKLSDDKWYGPSRCGVLWKSEAKVTPKPTQFACITVLTDGVMTTVSGGKQSLEEVAELANAIHDTLVKST